MANATNSIPSVPFNKTKMLSAMRKKGIFSVSALLGNHAFHRCYATMCQYFREEQMPIDVLEEICRLLEADPRDMADSIITDSQYESAKNGAAARRHPPALIECYPANVLAAALGLDRDDPASNVELAGYDLRPMYELDFLTERERQVISYRYFDKMTLDEVAAVYNVTRERIRQIEAKALRKIRSRRNKWVIYNKDEVYDNVKRAMEEIKAVIDGGEVTLSTQSADICTLDLSVRAYNCLRRAKIDTIQELIAFDQNQAEEFANGRYNMTWLGIRNMGRNTLKEVHDRVLDRIGYEIHVNIA